MKNSNGVFREGKSWYHRIKIMQPDGQVTYSKRGGFDSEAAALESLKIYNEQFLGEQRAAQMRADVSVRGEMLFKDYMVWWFDEMYSCRIESTTKMIGSYVLHDMILPSVEKDIKLRFLSVEYLDALLERASSITATAGNKSRELLSIALKDAVRQGILRDNPMERTRTYPRGRPKVTIFTKEKLRKFLEAASETDWYLEILLATFSGLRKGEILGLKFADVDYDRGCVHIQRQLTAEYDTKKNGIFLCAGPCEKPPKTENSNRVLKLPDIIMEEIRRRAEVIKADKERFGQNYEDHGYISCQSNGRPHSLSAMNIALTKLCRRNALEPISVHGLRHQYATILAEQGVPLVKISALLGHASIVTTFEYYIDQMDEEQHIISFMNDRFAPGEEGQDV